MGRIFKGKVWGKIRPMIEIYINDTEYHAGISHTQNEGMIEISENDLVQGSSLGLIPKSFAGLSNKSALKIEVGELGETTDDFDRKLLEANAKLKLKIEKRSR
jgi:hypothetical protein